MTDQLNDVWAAAESPKVRQVEFFGEVQIDMYFAVLVKGVGKVPFDPAQHSLDKRVTAIEISIIPLAEQNVMYPVNRSMIAESREWSAIVLPSIKALGISVRELNSRYVHVKQKPTGQTYTNSSGEVKERTTLEFIRLYPGRAECAADYLSGGANSEQPAPASNGDKERDTALQFLRVVVESAARGQTDIGLIQRTIAANVESMPLINKFFTAESPETLQLIAEKMAK